MSDDDDSFEGDHMAASDGRLEEPDHMEMVESDEDDVEDEDDVLMTETTTRNVTSIAARAAHATMPTRSSSNGSNATESPVEEDAAIQRRRAIQAIMRDTAISDEERRMRIQNLMSGGRTQVEPSTGVPLIPEQDSNACVHYQRSCSIVAPCCDRVFGCRVCHDEQSPSGHAPMNRFLVKEVVCKGCNTRQSAATNQCIQCAVVFGEYHCATCNLWMQSSKKPFHCHDCGFCRVGGVENFRHCHECCMCISVNVYQTHNCFKDKYKNNCPVCREDMFSSRQSPQDLPCGHAIHAHCFRKLAGFDYRCPICKKTVVSPESMSAAWEARARDIAEQPMPPDLQRTVDIICNDCEVKSHGRSWHFLGVQCPGCQSFNTVVEQVLSSGETTVGGGNANATGSGTA